MSDLTFDHRSAPAVAMPIGGIGTGGLAVGADGSLRQWQLTGMPNHRGALPYSGFFLRVTQVEPPLDVISMLQGEPVDDPAAPLVTDGFVPPWMREAAHDFGTFDEARFTGSYPECRVELRSPGNPVAVTLRALNPLVPNDVETSSIPAAMFEITLTNTDSLAAHGILAGSMLNMVGWDGITPIGAATPGLGGNVNRLRRGRGWTSVLMDNPSLAEDDPAAGQLSFGADAPGALALPRCTGPEHLRAFLEAYALSDGAAKLALAPTVGNPQLHSPRSAVGSSPAGRSHLAVVGVPFRLEPGASRTVRFALTWHFPNRMVDVEQFGPAQPAWGSSRFYLGNAYAQRYRDAADVADEVAGRWEELALRTRRWTATLRESDLAPLEAERMAAQAAYVRSPTCFIGADGRFYGYEGSLGASTTMWSGQFGGSCPLNCTHVWQYEAALAGLWPSLARNMTDTEFDVMQAPDGAIPHRLRVPVYLPQMWDEPIGGPEEPALDGMLATVLKSLRNVQRGAGTDWAQRRWPGLRRLMRHIAEKWDADGDGVLRGIQPSTHDIDLAGVNTFMGTLWLAALRAYEELGRLVGDDEAAAWARALFESGSARYDELLFDGTHYIQQLDDDDPVDFQWGTGTLSDQVIGQWWAHQLGLGHVLPAEHVASALRHVVAANLKTDFTGFAHPYRVYADAADDTGLLMCSWPQGGRPDVPTRYCDEVWTGIEWQVAAHCLFEGLVDEGERVLDGLLRRYDGSRRNPYNEIECGDHYARAMSGWTLVQARSGVRVDEAAGTMYVGRPGTWPWTCSTGFGTVLVTADDARIEVAEGSCDLRVARTA